MRKMRSAPTCSFYATLVLLAAVAFGVSCIGQRPVGEVALSANRVDLPYPGRQELTVSWTPWRTLPGLQPPLRVFVHLRDSDGTILRTFDHGFPSDWEPGQSVQYRLALYQSALGPSLASGIYELTIGLYDAAGHRWPLATPSPEVARYEYVAAEIHVPQPGQDDPLFELHGSWGEPERDEGVQILGRRWLEGPGELRLRGIGHAGRVWMRLRLAEATPRRELMLSGAGRQQAVRVSTDCGDGEQYLSGPGEHEISLEIHPPPDGAPDGGCQVRFEPNFHVVDLDTLARRVLQVHVLTWTPQARP